jgi:hypothetical protein
VSNNVPFVPCLLGAGFDPSDLYEPKSSSTIVINEPSPEYRMNHGELLYVKGMLNGSIYARILIDCGANTQFMSPSFAEKHQITLDELPVPQTLILFDGSATSTGKITHETTTRLNIARHNEVLSWRLTKLQKDCDMVLGIGWLRHHNPYVD